ncbi:MAG: hydroxyisourate hydrolase [Pseudomonadota bacterium]
MGKLTTHILDTARGCPGAGIAVRLYAADQERRLIVSTESNDDGRCDAPLLDGAAFEIGSYELEFDVAEYFSDLVGDDEAPFLDRVRLRFTMSRDEHYHVPLLVSPWSYSTYRGS